MDRNTSLEVTLLTGRTIEQGVGKERGKSSDEYWESAAVCIMDPDDLATIGINEGTNVRVSTEAGSVVLKATRSLRRPHQGTIFIPYGPWANVIVDSNTDSQGMPSLKGIPAKIEQTEERVLDLRQLLSHQFGNE